MSDQNWLEITVNAPTQELDTVCARLTFAGVGGLVIEEETDFQTFLEQNRACWDYVDEDLLARFRGVSRVKFYVTDDAPGRSALAAYTQDLGYEYTEAPVQETDWAYSWQKYYTPFAVGERLYIVPEWERNTPVPAGHTAVYLNPGLTFGTGSHASTRLCLEALQARMRPGDRVLDLGCGSGILSVAALRLGAAEAVAADIDPKAVDVAYENAALNGIGRETYTVLAGNILDDAALRERIGGRYDVVLANIVADVIIALAPEVGALLNPGGVFICSGIIDTRTDEVARALEAAGLRLDGRRTGDGWAALEAGVRA